MIPGAIKLDYDANAPLVRDPEVGLVLPPWAPPQMRVQMAAMPVDKKRQIMRQQLATVKQALGLDPQDTSVPTDAQYKNWLKIEFDKMKQMSAGGGAGGHSHGGQPCQGHGGQGGHNHGGHDHGGHSHGGGGHSHGGQPCQGHGGQGGHNHGGYGGGHNHGGGGGGHSHGGVPCQGHGGQGGHNHGGAPPPANPMSGMDGLLRSQAPLRISEQIDTEVATDSDSGLALPAWIPDVERAQILAMSVQRRRAMRRHQILSIKCCNDALEGTMRKPAAADLEEPSAELTRKWVQREWTKINLMKATAPPAAALVGQWVYGRRTDGDLSEYEFIKRDGKLFYCEHTASGGVLEGEVLTAAEGPSAPAHTQFTPVWSVTLGDNKGSMWFRVIDGVTIESLFVHEGAAAKGFKASSRRGWSSMSGAPETVDIIFSGELITDTESGLIVPPWAPAASLQQMKTLPLAERKRMKQMQDMPVRTKLGLKETEPVTFEQTKEWMKSAYEQHLEQQQQMAGMSSQQKMAFMQKKMAEQQSLVDKVGELNIAPPPETKKPEVCFML